MKELKANLYIFSGLPASGKTTLSQMLARHTNSAYLRIDTIEQALRDLCSINVQGQGYRLSYRIASDNLHLHISVVADSCNPISLTRKEWEQVAKDSQANFVNIEVICSDKTIHRNRIENRKANIHGLKLPTLKDVETREYHTWSTDRIVIDTAFKTLKESFDELISKLRIYIY